LELHYVAIFISISGAIICYVLELLGCDFFLRAGDTKYQLLLFEKLSQILPMISVANLIVSVLVVFSARENEEIREYFAMSYYVVAFLLPLAISMLLAGIYIFGHMLGAILFFIGFSSREYFIALDIIAGLFGIICLTWVISLGIKETLKRFLDVFREIEGEDIAKKKNQSTSVGLISQ